MMIDYKSKPEEFQKKFMFDNARMMANHMLDDDAQIMVTLGAGYYWSVMIGEETFSSLVDDSFERLTEVYLKFIK